MTTGPADISKLKPVDSRTHNGKSESLLRSKNGSYHLLTADGLVNQISYDEALEWIDIYSSRDKVNGIMLFDSNSTINVKFIVSPDTSSLLNSISAQTQKSKTCIVKEAVKVYAEYLENYELKGE